MYSLGILGGGRAAWAYGSAWRRIGWPIDGVWLRAESKSKLPELLAAPRKTLDALHADLLLIAVSDRAIDEVAALISGGQAPSPVRTGEAPVLHKNPIIFHASGAKASVRDGFSLHPLKALAPVGEPSDLDDALLVFEGNRRDVAESIASNIGARFAIVSKDEKARYHAAAVFGSNYIAALLDIAQRNIGIENVRDDLAALARSAIDNWRAHDDARRFTGPAARGDDEVIERHLLALAGDERAAEIYRLLADEIRRAILAPLK